MKILLAVDGSSYTAKAVDYICAHLDWFKGVEALHLLHVKAALPSGFAAHGARSVAGDASVDNYYREEAPCHLPIKKGVPGLIQARLLTFLLTGFPLEPSTLARAWPKQP